MNKLKKISIIGPAGTKGGLQTHHEELAIALKNLGHDIQKIDVLLVSGNQSEVASNSYTVNFSSSKFKKFTYWFNAQLKIINYRPDYLISNAVGGGYLLTTFVARLFTSAYVVRMEVTDHFKRNDKIRVLMNLFSHGVGLQSQKLISSQKEKLNRIKGCKVLPCFSKVHESDHEAKSINNSECLRFVFFGRLASNKGINILIESIVKINKSQNVSLDIWGSGPLRDDIVEKIKKMNASEYIFLKGVYPEGEEYSKLLMTYHSLLLPSQWSEGLPLVLLEAASVGLPFLATDIGAIKDCENNNPDVSICGVGEEAWNLAINEWIFKLKNNPPNNSRLKKWYYKFHARKIQENIWNEMIKNPKDFFEN